MPPRKRKRTAAVRGKAQKKQNPEGSQQQHDIQESDEVLDEDFQESCKRQKVQKRQHEKEHSEEPGVSDEVDTEDPKVSHATKSNKGSSKVKTSSEMKGYPRLLQAAMQSKTPLYANRRGIIPLHSHSDNTKPTIERSELIEQRRLGLSYKQIGRKLGIDPHKEDVIQVYTALDIDVQKILGPSKVSPPTPMWYLFDSEREVIKEHILPSTSSVLQLTPQERIASRLGESSGYMLAAYLKVAEIIDEEIQSAITGAPPKSNVGTLRQWDGGLSAALIHQSSSLSIAVGRAAYHLTDDWTAPEVGRCRCSATKNLRFGWRETPIPHPSFFWGCCRYSVVDAGMHDKGLPLRDTLWSVIDSDQRIGQISDRDLAHLSQKMDTVPLFWKHTEPDETMMERASALYGGPESHLPYKDKTSLIETLQAMCDELKDISSDRSKH